MAQLINEAKRMQQLAGIKESEQKNINEAIDPVTAIKAGLWVTAMAPLAINATKKIAAKLKAKIKDNEERKEIDNKIALQDKAINDLEKDPSVKASIDKIQNDPEVQKFLKDYQASYEKAVNSVGDDYGGIPGYSPANYVSGDTSILKRAEAYILKQYPVDGKKVIGLINNAGRELERTLKIQKESIDFESIANKALKEFRENNK
jgi:hypothetical protein